MATVEQEDADASVILFDLGSIFDAENTETNDVQSIDLPDEVLSELVYNVTDGKPEKFNNPDVVCNNQVDTDLQNKRFAVLSEADLDEIASNTVKKKH